MAKSIIVLREIPDGYDLGCNLDNKKIYFVRVANYSFARYKGLEEKFREKYGDIIPVEWVKRGNRLYLPPEKMKPKIFFKPIVEERDGFRVIIGGKIVEVE